MEILHGSRVAVALALVAIIFPTTFSAPATRSSCTPVCRQSQASKINYQEGKSYTYGFETEVITQVLGSTDEQSKIKVKGQAVIAAQSPCDFVLTVQQVAIQNPSGQAISRVDDIEGSSLRFSYQDGQVESVCVAEDDQTWSANVKRAIISMLTNRAEKAIGDVATIETDISGKCPTTYSVSGDKYVKTRDLNACAKRDGGATVFLGVPYNIPSKYNSMSVIDSILECTQELKDGVFQHIECHESHKVPFLSTKRTGVHTEIKSSLNLVSSQAGITRSSKVTTKPSSILFDHSDIQDAQRQKASVSRSVDFLKKLCQEIEDGSVSSKVPGLYLQLIKTLQTTVRKEDVKQMYEKITSGSMCAKATEKLQKLFVDAAATSGSDGSISFLAELIANDEVGCNTKTLFHTNAAFAPHPNTGALQAMESLISKSDPEPEYLLTASALAHQYCRMTNENCASNKEYASLVDKIAQQVRSVHDEEGIKKVVAALQALGNLDQLTPSAVTAISSIIDDNNASERLKVRALDAFRRDPCQQQLKQKGIKIFGDNKESSHVRIQAYLTVSKCFEEGDVNAIQTILNAEKSSQVGSFIASHIENALETASPSKQNLKTIFSQFTVPEDLRKDLRKFSRNSEYSTFLPNLNVGGSLEGNMIFSQDSYLPRMTSANLTVDAFGRSYNFLELGIYAEDFEHLVEKFFGPAGKIRQTNLEELISKGSEKLSRMVEGVRNRFKRDVKVDASQNELDFIRQKVDIEERTGDHGVGDVYIRVMGTSMMVESFDASHLREGSLSQKFKKGFQKVLEGAKDHKFDLTHPVVFIDEELILPTFSGLPLNLEIEGTSVVSMQMNGNIDIGSLFRGEPTDWKAKFIPSAATLLKSRMTVGAGPVESGLQLEGKVHSSAGIDVKMVREDGKFEFRFNLPQERNQIIDVRSDLYWVEQPQDSMEKKTPVQSKLTTKSLINNDCMTSNFVGLKFCADMRIPTVSGSAPFPILNGQAVFSVSVEKTESSMEGYYLKIEKDTQEAGNVGVSFLLDTPGSRANRKISASLKATQYKSTTPEYVFKLESPWTKLDVDYKRSFTDDLKGVELKVVSDGEAYNGKLQLKKVKAGSVSKYEPIIQYSFPGGRPVKLIEGQVLRSEGERKVEIDLRTAGPMRSLRGSVKGTIEVPEKSNGFEVKAKNLEFSSEMIGKIAFDGHVTKENQVLDTKVHAKYGQNKQHSFEFETKLGKPKHGHYEFKTKTRCSRQPFFNFDVHGEVVKEGHTYKSEVTYSRGLEEPKVHFTHKIKTTVVSRKEFEIFHESSLKHPTLNLDLYSKIDTKAAPGQPRHAEMVFNVNSFKSNAKYDSEGHNFLDYVVKATAEYSGKTYEFSEISAKASDHKQNFKTKFSVIPGFWYAADTDVTHKFEKSDMESTLSTTITSDTFTKPIVFKSGVRGKSEGYNALVKLEMKGATYLDFSTHFKHPKGSTPATFTFKGIILNYLDSKLTQTFKSSQCDMQLDVKWIPTGRKIEAKSKITNAGDVYNVDADLKWDAERDATKSASLKSVTNFSYSKLQFDSKNDVTVEGKLAKLNLKGQRMKELFNGEDNLAIDYTSPSGKTYNLASVLNLENKLKVKGGKINVKLTLHGEKPYDFTWENRVSNINAREITFEAVTDLKFDYKGEKDVSFHGEVGSSLPGNYRRNTGKVVVGGSVIPDPVSLNFKADIKKGKWALTADTKRGARSGDIDVVMDYDVWSPKKTLDLKYTINTPYTSAKSIEGLHKHGFLYNSLKNFEYTEEGSLALNHGSPAQWKYLTSVLNNEFKFLSELMQEGKNVYLVSADGKVTGKKFLSEIQLTYHEDKSFLNIDVDHQLPNLGFHLKGGIPMTSFELKTTHHKTSDGVYETDILAKTAEELAFRVTNKLEYTPTKNSIDLTVSAVDEPARRVFLLLNKANNDKYNLETLVRWGDGGKFLSTKGDVTRSTGGFEATFTLDSPELKANKLNVILSKKSQSGRSALNVKVQESSKDKLSAVLDYGSSLERSGAQKVFEGSATVKGDKSMMDIEFNGKFRLEDTSLARQRGDEEDGRQLKGTFEVGKSGTPIIKGTAVLKTSDKEKRAQLSLCNEGKGRCRSGDVHFRHQHDDNGDLEYSLRIVGETDAAGQKTITGLSVITAKTEDGRQMDHTVKLILNHQNSEQVGYRFYRKDGHEFGAELLLPERIIATVLDCKHPAPTDVNLDLSFYIDKTRQPTRKISFIFNTEKHKGEIGRDIEFIFRHPDVKKDLKVYTKYTIAGEEGHLFDVKTVVDIFKANSEIVMAYKALKESNDGGNLYTTQWSVISKGQSINFGGKSEISARNGQLSYKQELHYENRDKQTKTAKIETMLSMNRMSFEVKGHSGKLVSLISTFEDQPTGYEFRQEVLVPGMEDVRIFQALLTTTSPRKAQLKTYIANSPSIYYEAIIGFKTQNHFVAGVYDHEADGQKTLADFNVALNNNRILSVKSNWEKQNFKNVWTKVQARADRNGKSLKEIATSSIAEIAQELNFAFSNVIKSAPSVKSALTSAKNQFADLAVELDAHQDTKIIVEQFQMAQGLFKTYARFLVGIAKAARRMALTLVHIMKEQFEQIPHLFEEYGSKVPYTMEDFKKCMESFVNSMSDCARNSVKLMERTMDKISECMPEIIKAVNWALDKTSGINECIRTMLEAVLDKATIWWKSIRTYTKDFINNDLVKMFVKDTISLVRVMLAEFVEETKEYAETFKNYILKAIPEQDFQELVQLTIEYVEKKSKNVDVDDTAAIKQIYDKLVILVKKVSARWFTMDSSEGAFSASVMLPSAVNSLSEVMKVFKSFSFPSAPLLQYNLPSYRFGITEVINKIRHGACVDEFVPPYDAFGLVIGSQFYKTFDGQFFRFDGGCQYLLASDFEDGNFTVVVDYERKGTNVERAIVVKDATDTIAIKSDNTVVVNGRTYTATDLNTETPTTQHFKIETSHNNWIVVTGDKGVKVGCSSLHDVCGVKVNGFYHGKVLGLLGKFNQEKFDDLTTADGHLSENVNQFTESWKLEQQCTERPLIGTPAISSEATQQCSDAFESRSSTLRPCYGVVPPSDYQRMCERLSSSPGYTVSKAVCTASTGYAKACYLSYAKVDIPTECRQV